MIRPWKVLMIAFLFSVIGGVLFPYGFKFFAFIVPILAFAYVFRDDEKYRFNINVFTVMMGVYILLPTSLFTFDSSNPMGTTNIGTIATAAVGIIASVVVIGLGIFCALSAIWSFIIGRGDVAGKQILRLIIMTAIVMIVVAVLGVANIEIPVFSDLGNFYVTLIDLCFSFPFFLYDMIDTLIDGYNSIAIFVQRAVDTIEAFSDLDLTIPLLDNLPALPRYQMPKLGSISFNARSTEFSSQGYPGMIYSIHDSLPIIMGICCFITALFMIRKDWEKALLSRFKRKKEKEVTERAFLPYVNLKMLIFMFIIIMCAFYIFLSYTRSFGIDPATDYRFIGFFSIYMIMFVSSVIVLNLQGFTKYTDAELRTTFMGFIYGLLVMFFLTRLFMEQQVLDAFSAGGVSSETIYIINTFVFVAPAESMFFHVLWPALVQGKIEDYYNKKEGKIIEATRREELVDLTLQIKYAERYSSIAKEVGTKADYSVAQATLSDLEKERDELSEVEFEPSFEADSVFGRRNSLILYIIFAGFVGNFFFATAHWFVPYVLYDLDFFTFWICGLGIIYFAGGCWFTYLSFRWGWGACIAVHSVFNTMTYIAVVLLTI